MSASVPAVGAAGEERAGRRRGRVPSSPPRRQRLGHRVEAGRRPAPSVTSTSGLRPVVEAAEDLQDQALVEDDRRVRLLGAERAGPARPASSGATLAQQRQGQLGVDQARRRRAPDPVGLELAEDARPLARRGTPACTPVRAQRRRAPGSGRPSAPASDVGVDPEQRRPDARPGQHLGRADVDQLDGAVSPPEPALAGQVVGQSGWPARWSSIIAGRVSTSWNQ